MSSFVKIRGSFGGENHQRPIFRYAPIAQDGNSSAHTGSCTFRQTEREGGGCKARSSGGGLGVWWLGVHTCGVNRIDSRPIVSAEALAM